VSDQLATPQSRAQTRPFRSLGIDCMTSTGNVSPFLVHFCLVASTETAQTVQNIFSAPPPATILAPKHRHNPSESNQYISQCKLSTQSSTVANTPRLCCCHQLTWEKPVYLTMDTLLIELFFVYIGLERSPSQSSHADGGVVRSVGSKRPG
jgi:hypothetical protein